MMAEHGEISGSGQIILPGAPLRAVAASGLRGRRVPVLGHSKVGRPEIMGKFPPLCPNARCCAQGRARSGGWQADSPGNRLIGQSLLTSAATTNRHQIYAERRNTGWRPGWHQKVFS